jgi:hypothetical protein
MEPSLLYGLGNCIPKNKDVVDVSIREEKLCSYGHTILIKGLTSKIDFLENVING